MTTDTDRSCWGFAVRPRVLSRLRSLSTAQHAAFIHEKPWPQNSILTIKFTEGSALDIAKVQTVLLEHLQPLVNLRFSFVSADAPALVRVCINHNKSEGSYSYVGSDAEAESLLPTDKTMNFGWLDTGVILHEFGHALGLIHEHLRSDAPLVWNKPVVYARFARRDPPWSEQMVDENVFQTFDMTTLNASVYDPDSIMHYILSCTDFLRVPPGYGCSRSVNPQQLSTLDKRTIAGNYPRLDYISPGVPPVAPAPPAPPLGADTGSGTPGWVLPVSVAAGAVVLVGLGLVWASQRRRGRSQGPG